MKADSMVNHATDHGTDGLKIITGKIPVISKLAYGLGDASSTLLRIVIMTYLTYFYTDVAKLNLAAVGTMMLVTQIVSLVSAPALGYFVDRTHTRRGKSRPWFLGVAAPLGIFGALCFFTPDLSMTWRLAFAYITYNLYTIANNALHIPLGAILSNMSTDPNERQSANSWRMTIGQLAGALSALVTVPMVAWLGQGNEASGYSRTAWVYGIFAIVCTLFCYFAIHENVDPADLAKKASKGKKEKGNFREEVHGLRHNIPLYLLIIADFTNALFTSMGNSGTMYYLKYQLHNTGLMPIVSVLQYLSIVVIMLVPFLNKKFSKRTLFMAGAISIVVSRLILIFSPSIVALIIGTVIMGFSLGFGLALVYSMIADTVDYGEYKTGVRSQGLIFSLSSLVEGIATGVGSAFVGYILNWGGYVADAAQQTSSAMQAIKSIFLYIPMGCQVVVLIAMAFYKLDKKLPEVNKILNSRHEETAANTEAATVSE
jgi:GPH family glycoside/pentoside/hexuronide:cation symporter